MIVVRLFLYTLALLLAVLLAALLYLNFADLDRHRDQIAARVSAATGRDFEVGHLDLALWPEIVLTAEDVTLANASWGSEPEMAGIGRLHTRVDLASLFLGPPLVDEFVLEDVTVLVESGPEGESNWDIAPAGGAREREEERDERRGEEGGLPLVLRDGRIRNVAVTERQRGAEDRVIRLGELQLHTNADDQLELQGEGEMLTLPLALEGRIGARRGAGDDEDNLALSASLGELAVEARGLVREPGAAAPGRLALSVEAPEVARLIERAGLSLPLSGPLSAAADIRTGKGSLTAEVDGRLGETAVEVTVEPRGERQFDLDGRITALDKLGAMLEVEGLPADQVALAGTLTLGEEAVELAKFSAATGGARLVVSGTLATGAGDSSLRIEGEGESLASLLATLPALPFDAGAELALSAGELVIDPLRLQLGASDLAGKVRLATGEGDAIKADLVSKKLDFTELAGDEGGRKTEGAAAPATAGEGAGGKYVFTEEPLPFEQLQQNEAEVRLSAGTVVSTAVTLRDLELFASLRGGELKADLDFRTPAGGRSVNQVQLKTEGEQAQLRALVNMRKLRVNILSGKDAAQQDIPPIGVTLNLESSGGSPRALAAHSNGELLVTLGPGSTDAQLLRRFSGDILAQLVDALNPLAKKEPRTVFECGVVVLDIENGLAKLDPMVLQGEKIQILAGGELDLKTEALDIEFNTHPREGVGLSADMFVTPFVALKGTLASPEVGLNKKGTLLTAGAAFATGGLSLLVKGAADRAAGEIDHCKETLPKHRHPPLAGD